MSQEVKHRLAGQGVCREQEGGILSRLTTRPVPPLEFTVSGRKAFHYLPSACGSVMLTQLLGIIHTQSCLTLCDRVAQ